MKNNENFNIDFLCVGAPKCGTSWLYFCLREHPEICIPSKKEIDFFNQNNIFCIKHKNNYQKGIKWYKQFFKHCNGNKKIGEFSVNYIFDKKAPSRIYDNFPNTKIIMILRNPIERFHSHFYYLKAKNKLNNYTKKDNQKSLEENIATYEKEFLEIGNYTKHIKNYLKSFKKNQLLIINYENIKNNPQETLKTIYSFINVKNNFKPSSLNKKINTTSSKINKYQSIPWYHFTDRNIKYSLKIKNFLKIMLLNLIKQNKYPKINHHTKILLNKYYYQKIIDLEKLLQINLDNWKN